MVVSTARVVLIITMPPSSMKPSVSEPELLILPTDGEPRQLHRGSYGRAQTASDMLDVESIRKKDSPEDIAGILEQIEVQQKQSAVVQRRYRANKPQVRLLGPEAVGGARATDAKVGGRINETRALMYTSSKYWNLATNHIEKQKR